MEIVGTTMEYNTNMKQQTTRLVGCNVSRAPDLAFEAEPGSLIYFGRFTAHVHGREVNTEWYRDPNRELEVWKAARRSPDTTPSGTRTTPESLRPEEGKVTACSVTRISNPCGLISEPVWNSARSLSPLCGERVGVRGSFRVLRLSAKPPHPPRTAKFVCSVLHCLRARRPLPASGER